jgi:hypothetical protein
MKQLFAPNGKRIVGTADTVKAVANISHWDESGAPVFVGSSVDWDSQETRETFSNGERTPVVVDEDGQEWPQSECEMREQGEDDEANRVKVSITALGVCVGDRIVFHPTWPEGRLVVDVDQQDTRITVTYESDEECKQSFGAADHLVVWRKA